jgi:hypothetical protein
MSTIDPNRDRPNCEASSAESTKARAAAERPLKKRDCRIYERHILNRETQQAVATDYGLTQQRIAQIAARVEAWIAMHPEHRLAQRMRLRCSRRWETLWSEAMASFARSREDRRTRKARQRDGTLNDGGRAPTQTVSEETVREQNGDPRFLQVAWRAADREQQLWLPGERIASSAERTPAAARIAEKVGGAGSACDERFPYLPVALGDLEHLAFGLRSTAESAAGEKAVPVSTLFEQRTAEAFRCLGFEVRELGQGCGRAADCLAIAPVERFAVIIDAKVRRRGYALGTDDRQFCEYATRHTRELAQSGIDKVYFAVVGSGFRQDDLEKLAGFMSGTPIRSAVFMEAAALMKLVNDSIRDRRQFRLDHIDRLLFGNKILRAD